MTYAELNFYFGLIIGAQLGCLSGIAMLVRAWYLECRTPEGSIRELWS